ncbi:putative phage tail assembly chaperone [Yersinia enterocolitica]
MTDKNTQTDTLITLQIGEHEVSFAPTTQDYNNLQNELMPDNKVAPLKNYLRRVVIKEHRELLNELLEKPGMPLNIATVLNNEFVPIIDITVKK